MIRKLSFTKFGISMIAFFAIFFITMFSFFQSDQEMYYYFMNNEKSSGGQNVEEDVYKDDPEDGEEGGYYIQSYGLNLDLIDQMPDSYQKEMLSLMREAEQGKLNDGDNHVTVETLCGIQIIETGFFNNTHTLKSYIPYSNGKIIWNQAYKGLSAEQMTLRKFDKSCFSVIGDVNNLGPDGPFQDTGSDLDKETGDKYLYSNILTYEENRYLIKHLTKQDSTSLGFNNTSELSNTVVSSMYAAAHNRGESGAIQDALGIYFQQGDKVDSSAIHNSKDEDKEKTFGSLGKLVESKLNDTGHDDVFSKYVGSNYARAFADALVLLSDNWYFSESGAAAASKATVKNATKEIYSAISGDISDEEFDKLIKAKTSNVKDVMKKVNNYDISGSDIQKVYGISPEGDYSCYSPSGAYSIGDGAIFCVESYTSEAYKNKYSDGQTPYVIHCYDRVAAGMVVGSVTLGKYVYAYMLKEGGLDSVDPANPETYMKVNKIWVGGTQENGSSAGETLVDQKDVPKWLTDLDVDLTGLTYDRLKILELAHSHVGGKYNLGGDSWSTGIDCSHFVAKIYKECNFDVSFATTSSMVSGILKNKEYSGYKWIPTSDALPGDPVFCNGHAMLFAGWKKSAKSRDGAEDAIFIHASSPKNGIKMASSVGYFNMSSSKPSKIASQPSTLANREYIFIRAVDGWTTAGSTTVSSVASGEKPAFGTVYRTPKKPAKGYIAVQAGHYQNPESEADERAKQGDAKATMGATSVQGIPEHTFAYKASVGVYQNLIAAGYDVYLVRDTDTGKYVYGNTSRVTEANKQGCDAHVIIHWDSFSDSSVRGCRYVKVTSSNAPNLTQSQISKSNDLGKCIQKAYCKETGIKKKGAVVENLAAYKNTTIPIMLFECGFSSNKEEGKLMWDFAGSNIATGISNGIIKWKP